MFDSVLNNLSQQLLSNLYSNFMLCAESDTFKILASLKLCLFRYIQTYSRIFSIGKAYSRILRHLRHIQAYSGIFNILCNPCIFTTLSYSEPWHLEPEAYS